MLPGAEGLPCLISDQCPGDSGGRPVLWGTEWGHKMTAGDGHQGKAASVAQGCGRASGEADGGKVSPGKPGDGAGQCREAGCWPPPRSRQAWVWRTWRGRVAFVSQFLKQEDWWGTGWESSGVPSEVTTRLSLAVLRIFSFSLTLAALVMTCLCVPVRGHLAGERPGLVCRCPSPG